MFKTRLLFAAVGVALELLVSGCVNNPDKAEWGDGLLSSDDIAKHLASFPNCRHRTVAQQKMWENCQTNATDCVAFQKTFPSSGLDVQLEAQLFTRCRQDVEGACESYAAIYPHRPDIPLVDEHMFLACKQDHFKCRTYLSAFPKTTRRDQVEQFLWKDCQDFRSCDYYISVFEDGPHAKTANAIVESEKAKDEEERHAAAEELAAVRRADFTLHLRSGDTLHLREVALYASSGVEEPNGIPIGSKAAEEKALVGHWKTATHKLRVNSLTQGSVLNPLADLSFYARIPWIQISRVDLAGSGKEVGGIITWRNGQSAAVSAFSLDRGFLAITGLSNGPCPASPLQDRRGEGKCVIMLAEVASIVTSNLPYDGDALTSEADRLRREASEFKRRLNRADKQLAPLNDAVKGVLDDMTLDRCLAAEATRLPLPDGAAAGFIGRYESLLTEATNSGLGVRAGMESILKRPNIDSGMVQFHASAISHCSSKQ